MAWKASALRTASISRQGTDGDTVTRPARPQIRIRFPYTSTPASSGPSGRPRIKTWQTSSDSASTRSSAASSRPPPVRTWLHRRSHHFFLPFFRRIILHN